MMLLKKIKKLIKKYYHLYVLRRRYYRHGKCLCCGCCCENIYVRHGKNIIKTKEEFEQIKKTDDYLFYQIIEVIGQDDFGLIFECTMFDKEKRLCKNHKNRPPICVNYPSEEIFKMGACLKDGCGYSFEPIEKFSEVFNKISKKPVKNFENSLNDVTWEEFKN